MQTTRRDGELTLSFLTISADELNDYAVDMARIAHLGAIVDAIVPRDRQPGLLLTLARLQRQMTQSELAAEVGMHRSSIGDYETGERLPRPAAAQVLADALGLPVEVLRP